MAEEYLSLDFRLNKLDETGNHFIKKKWKNDLISKKHKKDRMALNCIKQ